MKMSSYLFDAKRIPPKDGDNDLVVSQVDLKSGDYNYKIQAGLDDLSSRKYILPEGFSADNIEITAKSIDVVKTYSDGTVLRGQERIILDGNHVIVDIPKTIAITVKNKISGESVNLEISAANDIFDESGDIVIKSNLTDLNGLDLSKVLTFYDGSDGELSPCVVEAEMDEGTLQESDRCYDEYEQEQDIPKKLLYQEGDFDRGFFPEVNGKPADAEKEIRNLFSLDPESNAGTKVANATENPPVVAVTAAIPRVCNPTITPACSEEKVGIVGDLKANTVENPVYTYLSNSLGKSPYICSNSKCWSSANVLYSDYLDAHKEYPVNQALKELFKCSTEYPLYLSEEKLVEISKDYDGYYKEVLDNLIMKNQDVLMEAFYKTAFF